MVWLAFILLGLAGGVWSGLVGLGGGTLIIPVLVYLFKMNQHQAQGTTLAMMVPPIGLLAAWSYYREGNANLPAAGLMCVGFVVGAYLGAEWAGELSTRMLQKVFGGALLVLSIKMLFFSR